MAVKRKRTSAHIRRRSRPFTAWQMDADFVQDLNPVDREWYRRFEDEYYQNATKHAVLPILLRRERWRAYQTNRKDLLTRQIVDPETSGEEGFAIYDAQVRVNATDEDAYIARIDAKRAEELDFLLDMYEKSKK